MRIRWAVAVCLVGLCLPFTPAAEAAPGKRAEPAAPRQRTAKKPSKKPAPAAKPPSKTSAKNKAPRKAGTDTQKPDADARTTIAGDPSGDRAVGGDAPELDALRQADDVLFPAVPTSSGFAKRRPVIATDGLPPQRADAAATPVPDVATDAWLGKLQTPDIPFRWDERLVRYLDYFKNDPKGRGMVVALIKRTGKYDASIRKALKAKGLPEDLAILALVESGMNPRAISPAGATGLWQFTPKAATAYGLRMDRWVDERLDPERSTRAAVGYLTDLHRRFGRWELAMAAYNMGYGGLMTSIRKFNTNDFWELSQLEAGVPFETALYVPKIVALAFAYKNREVFGCADLTLDAEEPFDAASPLPDKSLSAPTDKATTTGKAAAAGKAAGSLMAKTGGEKPPPADRPELKSLEPYRIRWGESLELLARERGTTESKLRKWNGLVSGEPPRPGTTILLPRAKAKSSAEPVMVVQHGAGAPVAEGKRRVFYEVVWGDDLDAVARALGVGVDDLRRLNNIDPAARLQAKMILQAVVDAGKRFTDVRTVEEKEATILQVGSSSFFDHFESKNGRTRIVLKAKAGDTFPKLAKAHGLSIGMMERINQRPRSTKLAEGDTVVVYTTRPGAAGTQVATPAREDATVEGTAVAETSDTGTR